MHIQIKTQFTLRSTMQLMCAIVIALIPILFSYKQIFSISPTYITLIICSPFVMIQLINRKKTSVKNVGWIAAYLLYCLASHGIGLSELIVTVIFLLYALAVNNGIFNENLIWKVVVAVSCIATVGVLLQTLCYYILGMRLFLCPTHLMEETVWRQYGVQTAEKVYDTGLYRPASFFLEPSMFAQYVVIGIMFLRLSGAKDIKNFRIAIFLSVGVIASTSGIGIATLIVIWLLSYWTEIAKKKNLLKGLYGIFAFVIVFFVAYSVSDSLKEAVLRIFGFGNMSDYSAFAGRTRGVRFMFDALKGKPELWFGTGEYIVRWYTWGFLGGIFRTVYEYGMIGATLFVFAFFSLGLRTRSWQKWIAFYVLALCVVTGMPKQYIMFFYLLICCVNSRQNHQNTYVLQ